MDRPDPYDGHGVLTPRDFTVSVDPAAPAHNCLSVAQWSDDCRGRQGRLGVADAGRRLRLPRRAERALQRRLTPGTGGGGGALDLRGVPREPHPTPVEHVDEVGDGERLLDVLLDHDDQAVGVRTAAATAS